MTPSRIIYGLLLVLIAALVIGLSTFLLGYYGGYQYAKGRLDEYSANLAYLEVLQSREAALQVALQACATEEI